jgi:hypothetical protein
MLLYMYIQQASPSQIASIAGGPDLIYMLPVDNCICCCITQQIMAACVVPAGRSVSSGVQTLSTWPQAWSTRSMSV